MIRNSGSSGGANNGNGNGRHREELQYVNSDRISDYYNALFRNVRYRLRRSPACQAIGICSLPGCGQSSVVATNLALCIAQHDSERVLLVNADPSNRVAEVTFSLDAKLGFYDTLWGECDPDEVIQSTNLENLQVVSCGFIPKGVKSLQSFRRFDNVLDRFKSQRSVVILDLPMASELTPCFDIAAGLDGVLLEIELNQVKQSSADRTISQLEMVKANLVGCVVKNM